MVSPDHENDAFASGLIHDAGKLVLDKYLLERNDVFTRFLSEGDKTFLEAEKQILGFDHAEIASEMCRTWKIPDALVRRSIITIILHAPVTISWQALFTLRIPFL
jgi:HD-like signal output (HDOD) protein